MRGFFIRLKPFLCQTIMWVLQREKPSQNSDITDFQFSLKSFKIGSRFGYSSITEHTSILKGNKRVRTPVALLRSLFGQLPLGKV